MRRLTAVHLKHLQYSACSSFSPLLSKCAPQETATSFITKLYFNHDNSPCLPVKCVSMNTLFLRSLLPFGQLLLPQHVCPRRLWSSMEGTGPGSPSALPQEEASSPADSGTGWESQCPSYWGAPHTHPIEGPP